MGFEEIKERWHIIDGYEDYAITESGKVYSYRQDVGYKGLREKAQKGLNNPKRYLSVILFKNDNSKTFQIHRLVGKYFVEGYFDGAEIDHKDKNIHNNNYTNLEWVTHKENIYRSYSTMSQVRNYKLWRIVDKNGNESNILKGHSEILEYIKDNNLDIKISMLEKHKKHNGYKLIEVT